MLPALAQGPGLRYNNGRQGPNAYKGARNMDVQRISEMEEYLNECTEATAGLCAQLDRMEA